MQIKVLGCSGGIGSGLRTTSLLFEREVLIDAGTGVGDLSLEQMQAIAAVYITHSHLDHVCGLAFMADNLFDLIDKPIDVYTTAPTLSALREHLFNWKLWPDFSKLPSEERGLIRFHEILVGQSAHTNCKKITAFEVLHTVPAVGYAVEGPAGTFVFTGDTYATDKLWDFLNQLPRVDKLMIDVAFTDEQAELGRISRHFTPELLGQELAKLKHRPELLLTHHKPGFETRIEQECAASLGDWNYRHLRRGDLIDL